MKLKPQILSDRDSTAYELLLSQVLKYDRRYPQMKQHGLEIKLQILAASLSIAATTFIVPFVSVNAQNSNIVNSEDNQLRRLRIVVVECFLQKEHMSTVSQQSTAPLSVALVADVM